MNITMLKALSMLIQRQPTKDPMNWTEKQFKEAKEYKELEDMLSDSEKIDLREYCWSKGIGTPKSLSFNYKTQTWIEKEAGVTLV